MDELLVCGCRCFSFDAIVLVIVDVGLVSVIVALLSFVAIELDT